MLILVFKLVSKRLSREFVNYVWSSVCFGGIVLVEVCWVVYDIGLILEIVLDEFGFVFWIRME